MKWRFMAALMSFVFLVLLAQDLPLTSFLAQVERDRLVTSLQRDAFVLAGRSVTALTTGAKADVSALATVARSYRDAGRARIVIVNTQGTAVVISDDDQSGVGSAYLSRPEIAGSLAGSIQTGSRYSQTLQLELLYVSVPVFSGQKILGAVRLTYPAQVVTDAVNMQLGLLGLVALTTVLLAGVIGFIFSSSVTRRLRLLQQTTVLLARGELHARADERTGAPEVRALSKSFNLMASRLEALVAQQRSFAADASHQLRTPLTALRLRLERARELLPLDPEAAASRLGAAEAETERLLTIIEGLLLLNRTEGQDSVPKPVDVAAVARERAEQWQALANELRVTIRYDGPDRAVVLAVDTAPEQVVDNYLDNALSVSPADSEVAIRVRIEGKLTRLEVLDSGPGLSAEDRAQAFDRFWRGDSQRSGSGLGLAIVAQLMQASGGRARLEPRPVGGLAAVAEFDSA